MLMVYRAESQTSHPRKRSSPKYSPQCQLSRSSPLLGQPAAFVISILYRKMLKLHTKMAIYAAPTSATLSRSSSLKRHRWVMEKRPVASSSSNTRCGKEKKETEWQKEQKQ